MVTAHPACHAVVPTRSVRAKAGGFAIYHRVETLGKSKAARSATVQRPLFNAFGVRRSAALWMMAIHDQLQRTYHRISTRSLPRRRAELCDAASELLSFPSRPNCSRARWARNVLDRPDHGRGSSGLPRRSPDAERSGEGGRIRHLPSRGNVREVQSGAQRRSPKDPVQRLWRAHAGRGMCQVGRARSPLPA